MHNIYPNLLFINLKHSNDLIVYSEDFDFHSSNFRFNSQDFLFLVNKTGIFFPLINLLQINAN